MKRKIERRDQEARFDSSDEDSGSDDGTYSPADDTSSINSTKGRRTKLAKRSHRTASSSDVSSDSDSTTPTPTPTQLHKDQPIRRLKQRVVKWIRENYTVGEDGWMAKADIFAAYQVEWRARASSDPDEIELTAPAFGRLVHKAFPGIKSCRMGPRVRARHCYKGLQLREGSGVTTLVTSSPRSHSRPGSPREDADAYASSAGIPATTSLSPPLASPVMYSSPIDLEDGPSYGSPAISRQESSVEGHHQSSSLSLTTSDLHIDLEHELNHSGLLGLGMSDSFSLKREPASSEDDHQHSTEEHHRRSGLRYVKAEEQHQHQLPPYPSYPPQVNYHEWIPPYTSPSLSVEGETGSPLPLTSTTVASHHETTPYGALLHQQHPQQCYPAIAPMQMVQPSFMNGGYYSIPPCAPTYTTPSSTAYSGYPVPSWTTEPHPHPLHSYSLPSYSTSAYPYPSSFSGLPEVTPMMPSFRPGLGYSQL